MANSPLFFLMLSAVLFALGATGVAIRRNPLVMFMSIEMMLNAANLALLAFARFPATMGPGMRGGPNDGPVFAFIVMFVAAAEAVVGLAIIITIFRNRQNVDVDELTSMKG
jgi:NADH-quinone oxidoreductase subunit K